MRYKNGIIYTQLWCSEPSPLVEVTPDAEGRDFWAEFSFAASSLVGVRDNGEDTGFAPHHLLLYLTGGERFIINVPYSIDAVEKIWEWAKK